MSTSPKPSQEIEEPRDFQLTNHPPNRNLPPGSTAAHLARAPQSIQPNPTNGNGSAPPAFDANATRKALENALAAVHQDAFFWPELTGYAIPFNVVRDILGENTFRCFRSATRQYLLCRPFLGGIGNVNGLVEVAIYLHQLILSHHTGSRSCLAAAELKFLLGEIATTLISLRNVSLRFLEGEGLSEADLRYHRMVVNVVHTSFAGTINNIACFHLEEAMGIFAASYTYYTQVVCGQRLGLCSAKLGDFYSECGLAKRATKHFAFAFGFLTEGDKASVHAKLMDSIAMEEEGTVQQQQNQPRQ